MQHETSCLYETNYGDTCMVRQFNIPKLNVRASNYLHLICLAIVFFTPVSGFCDISFEDVSQKAGVSKHSPTAASAWGDYNSDGWPDLWVSNHHGKLPTLYLNQKDGTFIDIASEVLTDNPRADFHGAAWADFDNDGDQDLFVTTGGGAGRGVSANYLFVNHNGTFIDNAKALGVDYPLGRGRTPLWMDANQDGKLDLLMMNEQRKENSSALFIQTENGFVKRNKEFQFKQAPRSNTEKLLGRLSNLMKFRYPSEPGSIVVSEQFAQLADISGNNEPELIAYMQPMRIFSNNSKQFNEITNDFVLPDSGAVQDAAIEDFNSDGQLDWFLTRSQPWVLDVIQPDTLQLYGIMKSRPDQHKAVLFKTKGDVTFELFRVWMDPTDPARDIKPTLFVGSQQQAFTEDAITIQANDQKVREGVPAISKNTESIAIEFDPDTGTWALKSSVKLISFKIKSTKPIESFKTQNFKPSKGALNDILLIKNQDEFISQKTGITRDMTACSSIVAGDFDNDMDIDIYLVCTGTIENLPNILYENDGLGNFVKVKSAGGAAGNSQGRGNQAVSADYDRDGFLDLFVTNGLGPPPFAGEGPYQLFHNLGNDNHWLEIDLQGVTSNRDGIGAKVILQTEDRIQVRQQGGGMHSFSQNHARIHFGLGAHQKVDKLTIYWPGGTVQHLVDIQANQILQVKEQASRQ